MNGAQASQAGGDRGPAATGRGPGGLGQAGGGGDLGDRRDGADVYRWRAGYGGLKPDPVRRPKLLEQKDGRLHRAILEPTLERLILKAPAEPWPKAASVGWRRGQATEWRALSDYRAVCQATIRSDDGPEFMATAVKAWITGRGAKPACIEPGILRCHFTCCAGGTLASSARGERVRGELQR